MVICMNYVKLCRDTFSNDSPCRLESITKTFIMDRGIINGDHPTVSQPTHIEREEFLCFDVVARCVKCLLSKV